eukprot:1496522-Rhodomonas_salina.4
MSLPLLLPELRITSIDASRRGQGQLDAAHDLASHAKPSALETQSLVNVTLESEKKPACTCPRTMSGKHDRGAAARWADRNGGAASWTSNATDVLGAVG